MQTATDSSALQQLQVPTSARTALRRALGRLRRAFELDAYDVFARGVLASDGEFRAPAGYRFGWGQQQDLAACEARHTELDERERRSGSARLSLGHKLVLAFARRADGGEYAVFSMWVNPRHLNVPGHLKRRLRSDQVFIYKAFTSPEHRGRKLYECGMRFVLADLAERGLAELVGYAHVKKTVSRKGLASLGFEPLGRFWRLKTPLGSACLVSRQLKHHFPHSAAPSQALADAQGSA